MPASLKTRIFLIVLIGLFIFAFNALWGLNTNQSTARSTQQNYEECQSLFVEIQKLRSKHESRSRTVSKVNDLLPQVMALAEQIGIPAENIQYENAQPVAISGSTLQKIISTLQIAQVDTFNLVSFLADLVRQTGAEIESIDMQQPDGADPLDQRWDVNLQISVLYSK